MKELQLKISDTLLIGEIGLSHEGSLGIALAMVKECKKANLDYAKFQFHNPNYESTVDEKFRINVFPQDLTRHGYWERTSFSENEWRILIDYCNQIGIRFLCTPFSVWAAQKLKEFGQDEIKIASGDANNWEILTYAKNNFSRLIISTGMSTREEVNKLLDFMSDFEGDLVIMQCTSRYPVPLREVGLRYLHELEQLTDNFGLSDHTGNPLTSMAAIAVNAYMVEFHVVFSRDQFGPDSISSITFEEAKTISDFRNVWREVNSPRYDKDSIANSMKEIREKFGRGLALKESLAKGSSVREDNFTLKKPLGPLGWNDRWGLIGKKANRDLKSNHHINELDFE